MARTITYDINVNEGSSLTTVGALEVRLQELNAEIRNVDTQSASFRILSTEIQATTAQLERANVAIEGFTSQRRRQALQGSIDVFTGGIEAISGIAIQLGITNEEFEETVVQLLAVSQTANGIRTVSQGLGDLRESLRGSAAAQRILNAAVNANPYVLVASAVIALGAAYLLLSENIDEARVSIDDSNESLERANELNDGSLESLLRLAEANLEVSQAELTRLESLLNNNQLTADYIIMIKEQIAAQEDLILAQQRAVVNAENNIALRDQEIQLSEERRIAARREIEELEANDTYFEVVFARRIELAETLEEREELIHQRKLARIREEVNAVQANLDDEIGALNDFATQIAVLDENNRVLAVAAVVTNAAVAGIAAWRSWTEDGPFGPIGNQIGAIAQLGIIAAGSAAAISNINNASSGVQQEATVPFSASSATTAIPAASPTGTGPNASISDVMNAVNDQNINNTVLLTPTSGPGSLQDTISKDDRRENRRRLGG